MATAKKLPSGSWRCLVYSHSEPQYDKNGLPVLDRNGKQKKRRIYESFTSDDPTPSGKRDAEAQAAAFAANKENYTKISLSMTFGEALDSYIESRKAVLSPRTIMDYKRIQKNSLATLKEIHLSRLTQEDIQVVINLESKTHSPKTVRNTHGLISAVLAQYRPDMRLITSLPKRIRPELYVPSEKDIQQLMQAAQGTPLELPILLAAFGPMRRGEIAALDTNSIKGTRVHVCRNMVLSSDGKSWVIKQPKSYAGDRYIDYPDFVAEKWKHLNGRITELTPNNITDQFRALLKKSGLPHFRFHDLRHYSASIQHALGVPDAYIMQRGGWVSDGTLKNVYRHTLSAQTETMNLLINRHFGELYNTKCNTMKKEP